jgi:hypothetical protein
MAVNPTSPVGIKRSGMHVKTYAFYYSSRYLKSLASHKNNGVRPVFPKTTFPRILSTGPHCYFCMPRWRIAIKVHLLMSNPLWFHFREAYVTGLSKAILIEGILPPIKGRTTSIINNHLMWHRSLMKPFHFSCKKGGTPPQFHIYTYRLTLKVVVYTK